jgi:hypothetical protein
MKYLIVKQLSIDNHFPWDIWFQGVGSMCVATMSLCMIVLIVTRKRGDGRYYFALWQTNNNTPNKMLISESAVSCLLRVRSVSFTSLSHEVGVFLEEAICYFIYAKFADTKKRSLNTYVLDFSQPAPWHFYL